MIIIRSIASYPQCRIGPGPGLTIPYNPQGGLFGKCHSGVVLVMEDSQCVILVSCLSASYKKPGGRTEQGDERPFLWPDDK